MKEVLGILGGGQLGRMLIQSAIDFNIEVKVLDNAADAPCATLAGDFKVGDLKDFETVYQFGQLCDIITIEIEKVNTEAIKKLRNEGKKVYPQPEIIELIQDKRLQKQFYVENNFPTAEFIVVDNLKDVENNKSFLPAVNKLAKDGYDGRGVQILKNEKDLHKAFDAPGILEKLVPIHKEIAVIVARNPSGETRAFPAVEMVFHPEANLVEYLFSPAEIVKEIAEKAEKMALNLITKLEMVGLLAVEMFITESGDILINEVAPRPHNSGHQSIEGNITSQFEQHLRSIFDLPLGDTSVVQLAAMVNLLGAEGFSGIPAYKGLDTILKMSGVHLHLYGKKKTAPFRKMGHITIADFDKTSLLEKVNFVKNNFKIES